jgi:predicted amidophosphoribosyltransferase
MGAALARITHPVAMQQCAVVLAVPTTRQRERERGYNQAALIAQAFARETEKVYAEWLERAPAASSQTTLQPAKRAANVAGAFRLRSSAADRVQGARPAHR